MCACLWIQTLLNPRICQELKNIMRYVCIGHEEKRDVKTVLHSTFCLLVSIMFVIICQIRSLIPLKHSAMKV